jgi:hypothetical protein
MFGLKKDEYLIWINQNWYKTRMIPIYINVDENIKYFLNRLRHLLRIPKIGNCRSVMDKPNIKCNIKLLLEYNGLSLDEKKRFRDYDIKRSSQLNLKLKSYSKKYCWTSMDKWIDLNELGYELEPCIKPNNLNRLQLYRNDY